MGIRGGTFNATFGGEALIVGGDIVISALGVPVGAQNAYELWNAALRQLRPGDQISVRVLRRGTQIDLTTTFVR